MSVKNIFFCFILLFVAGCASKKTIVQPVKKQPIKKKTVKVVEKTPVEKSKQNEVVLDKFTLAYIERFAPIAVKKMHTHKIPASITLAQGVLESGSGKSELAVKSNNHFGIKCHTNWSGDSVTHDDDEIGECFRKYQQPESSYEDHSAFLTQRKRYAFLFSFGTKDYKNWAKGLKDAGYATDIQYPEKLIKIIEDYKLHEFDHIKENDEKFQKLIEKFDKKIQEKTEKETFYEVQKGDTLYSISKRFMISVDDLKNRNNLKDDSIAIGQVLKLN